MKQGWAKKTLKEVCAKITDGTHQTPKYFNDGIIFLSSKNVTSGKIDWDNIKYIDEKQHQEMHKRVAPKVNDILLAKNGTTGVAAIVDRDIVFDIYVSLAHIRTLDEILPKFMLYFINSPTAKKQFNKRLKGIGVPNLHLEEIREVKISYPKSLPEQKRIVAILDKAFTSIAKAKANAEQNLKNAKELFDSSLSKAVIGKKKKKWREENGPEKANGSLELKQILLQIKGTERKKSRGEGIVGHELITNLLPKKWGVTIVESLFNLIDYRGKTPPRSNKGFRLITAKNIKMGYLSDEPITFVSAESYKKWMIRGFPKLGDIFFVTEGHTMGFVALNNRSDNFALAQRTITLQPAVPFDTKFLFYFMLSPYFQKIVKLNATGAAAVGMKGSKFRSLPLPFPSIAEQQTLVKKLDTLSSETKKLEAIYQQKIDDLKELKKSILQKAFNGELT